METQKINNERLIMEMIGKECLITDNMWNNKRCRVVGYGEDLVIAEYDPFTENVELDITENTPALYVITENGYEIGILIDEIVNIEMIDDNVGEAC